MLDYEQIQAREAVIQSAVALADLQASHVAIYLTLLFAYSAVAYIAGNQLTRPQLALTTSLFVGAATWEVFSIVALGMAAKIKREQIFEFGGRVTETFAGAPDWMLFVLWSSGAAAALAFMWTVRHPKTE